MLMPGKAAKILLIDSNVLFAKRLGESLKREGFEVTSSTQASFALTTLEYDTPSAIVCATKMREMGALEIARIIRADAKNNSLPIIAMGDGSQRALMEAFQAGCDDYIDRHLAPATIANHVKNIIISKLEGFQPTQMLGQADTSLSGNLTHRHHRRNADARPGPSNWSLDHQRGRNRRGHLLRCRRTHSRGVRLAVWRRSGPVHLEKLCSVRLRRIQICLRCSIAAAHRFAFRHRFNARRDARV